MTDAKPLHVQVAEALPHVRVWQTIGGAVAHDEYGDFMEAEPGDWLEERTNGGWYHVPRYDTDWSVTGPLIERYRITVQAPAHDEDPWLPWTAHTGFALDKSASTPLEAVCYVILALKEAGKLEVSVECGLCADKVCPNPEHPGYAT